MQTPNDSQANAIREETLSKFDAVISTLKAASSSSEGETQIKLGELTALVERSQALYIKNPVESNNPEQNDKTAHELTIDFATKHMTIVREMNSVIGELRERAVFLAGMKGMKRTGVELTINRDDIDFLREANKTILDQLTYIEWPAIKPEPINTIDCPAEVVNIPTTIPQPDITPPVMAPPTIATAVPPAIPTIRVTEEEGAPSTPPPRVKSLANVYVDIVHLESMPQPPHDVKLLEQVKEAVQEVVRRPSTENLQKVSTLAREAKTHKSSPWQRLGEHLLSFATAVVNAIKTVASAIVSGVRSFSSHKDELQQIKSDGEGPDKGPTTGSSSP